MRQAAAAKPEIADLAVSFEKVMALQQVTLESYESLAASLGLLERITRVERFVVPEGSDAG